MIRVVTIARVGPPTPHEPVASLRNHYVLSSRALPGSFNRALPRQADQARRAAPTPRAEFVLRNSTAHERWFTPTRFGNHPAVFMNGDAPRAVREIETMNETICPDASSPHDVAPEPPGFGGTLGAEGPSRSHLPVSRGTPCGHATAKSSPLRSVLAPSVLAWPRGGVGLRGTCPASCANSTLQEKLNSTPQRASFAHLRSDPGFAP
jgi:hypothetical protein